MQATKIWGKKTQKIREGVRRKLEYVFFQKHILSSQNILCRNINLQLSSIGCDLDGGRGTSWVHFHNIYQFAAFK